jgi:hypothetical protein
MYVLEAQMPGMEGYVHIGYHNKVFESKKEAARYYDSFHLHMPSLNSRQNWCSELNPATNLRHVVRRYEGEYLNLPSFGTSRRIR